MKKSLLMTAAVAGLALTSCASDATAQSASKSGETVMCHGVNSCKGHGDCGGKVDACSGKNGCSEKLTCKGHNSCKGKGLKKMSKKECAEKKGTVAS